MSFEKVEAMAIAIGLTYLAQYAKQDWLDQLENYLFMKCLASVNRTGTIMSCCLDNCEGVIGSFISRVADDFKYREAKVTGKQ